MDILSNNIVKYPFYFFFIISIPMFLLSIIKFTYVLGSFLINIYYSIMNLDTLFSRFSTTFLSSSDALLIFSTELNCSCCS